MSVNVSLVDTPGVSVYFDGQPIQDLQEAELQREEERQEKELRHLLETELEDFEEDFLSASNSEDEDENNISGMSGRNLGNSPWIGARKSPRGSRNPQDTPPSPLSTARGKSQSIPEGLNFKDDVVSRLNMVGNPGAHPVIAEHQLGRPDPHGHSVSLDNLVHVGTEARSPNRQLPGCQAPSNQPQDHHPTQQTPGQLIHGQIFNTKIHKFDNTTNSNSPYQNRKLHTEIAHNQNNQNFSNNLTKQLPHSIQHDDLRKSIDENDEGCDVSDIYLNLPEKQEDIVGPTIDAGSNFPWANRLNEAAYGYSPQMDGMNIASSSGDNAGFVENGYNYGMASAGNQPIPSETRLRHIGNGEGDEWMMQIQAPATSVHPHFHQSMYQPQQQQQHSPYQHPHRQRHHHHHHQFQLHNQQYQGLPYSSHLMQQQQQSNLNSEEIHGTRPDQYTKHGTTMKTNAESSTTKHPLHHQHIAKVPTTIKHLVSQGHTGGSRSPSPPPLPSTSPPPLTTAVTTTNVHSVITSIAKNPTVTTTKQQMGQKREQNNPADDPYGRYKVHYHKGETKTAEEEFYLKDDDIEFFKKDGPEDRRTYEQLEILYRARGREIEELNRKLEEKEEAAGKELRILKHKLAMATGESEGTGESLRQCQKLLQQAKADNSEANGKIKALETQVASLKDTKEELIKKLQTAEATIENLSHHIEELQDSESLSRARNEHDAMISSLTQRYEKELLGVKEKFDDAKAALESKQEELVYVKKQLADATHELEQAQISRGETINRLARSLEDSQKQCQALLEQSSSHEISSLRVQLQQSLASKRISEDLCNTFQSEIKELKEQLNMFESASSLGVFGMAASSHHGPSHDDSMTDLGIRKTLDFDTPQSVARYDGTQSSDELITSLRSELERCLRSNKQKRAEVAEKAAEVKTLQEEAEGVQRKISELERTCSEQKKRLQEIDALTAGNEDGMGIIEARLRKDIENLKREKSVLLEDIEDYKKRLEEIGASEATLTEINAELSHQVSQMVTDFDSDKHAALERCQRTMEEVNRMSIENLRVEMEERFKSEKTMLVDHYEKELTSLKQQLESAQSELDNVKSLYIKTCEESVAQEAEFTVRFKKQLGEELQKMEEKLEREKKEWEHFMRDDLQKKQAEEKESLTEELKKQMKENLQKEWEAKISQARVEGAEKERGIRQSVIDEAIREAKTHWDSQNSKDLDIEKLVEEKTSLESDLKDRNEEISELKQKLDASSTEWEGKFQKNLTELESEWKAKLATLEQQHAEEVNSLTVNFDKEKEVIEEKLREMGEKFSSSLRMNSPSRLESENGMISQDTQRKESESCRQETENLLKNVEVLERKLKEKESEIKELESDLETYKTRAGDEEASQWLQNQIAEKDKEIERLKIELVKKEEDVLKVNTGTMETENSVRDAETDQYRAQIQELEEKLQHLQQEKSKLDSCSSSDVGNMGLSDRDERNSLTEELLFDFSEADVNKLKEHIKTLQSKVKDVRHQYEKDTEELKAQHRKEFEKAARAREEKFQSELRYFLKGREDRGKTKLEKAVKECEAKAKVELEKVVTECEKKHKIHLEKSACEYAERSKAELKVAVLECEKRIRKEMEEKKQTEDGTAENQMMERMSQINEVENEKLKQELEILKEKFEAEKLELEKKVKQTEIERDNEIASISLRHEEEEKWMRGNFEREVSQMKIEYQKEIDKLKKNVDERNKSESSVARNLLGTLERENAIEKEVTERVRKEVEKMKGSLSADEVRQKVDYRIQEERVKWLKDANDYISNEIKQGVEEKTKEREEKLRKEWENRLREEKEKTKQEMEFKLTRAEREKEEALKEQERRIWEELEGKKDMAEQEKEEMVKERVKKKVEIEVANLKKKFVSELEARVMKEKSRLEQEVTAWKDDMKKRMEDERNRLTKKLHADLERKLAEEKKRMEEEIMRVKEEEMREMREEMEREMRTRIQRERKEWEEERDGEKGRGNWERAMEEETEVGWRERLQSEVEARTKACSERDKAVEFIKAREITHREEKQKLLTGLKKCREDLEDMKKEHVILEEKYTEMDRKYKADMKEARKTREQDLAQLKLKLEEEKQSMLTSFKVRVRELEEKYRAEMERVKQEGEKEKASLLVEVRRQAEQALTTSPIQLPDSESSTILELRDQYLDTVAKIKADVMAHVQEANVRAAATMKAEIRKQKAKIIEVFKIKCKANIRSALTGQVSVTCITALEHSIDVLSDHLISTPTAGTTSSTPRSDNSNKDGINVQHLNDDPDQSLPSPTVHSDLYKTKDIIFEKVGEGSDVFTVTRSTPAIHDKMKKQTDAIHSPDSDQSEDISTEIKEREGKDMNRKTQDHQETEYDSPRLQQQKPSTHHHAHPQLDKVDLYDMDTFHQTPSSSNNSSPAEVIRTKSKVKSSKPHIDFPDVPPLNLSPNIAKRPKSSTEKAKSPVKPATKKAHTGSPEMSPRDDMKVIEARVRLAKWARSGEMPWKPSNEISKGGSPSVYTNTKELQLEGRKSRKKKSKEEAQFSSDEKAGKEKFTTGDHRVKMGSRSEKIDTDDFVKPGIEAKQWVRAQREKLSGTRPAEQQFVSEYNFPQTSDPYFYKKQMGEFSDDSASSVASHNSFVTLEPEGAENTGARFQSMGIDHESLTKGGKSTSDQEDDYGDDYDRIRAAVFGHIGSKNNEQELPHTISGSTRKKGSMYRNEHQGSAESVSSEDIDRLPFGKDERVYSKTGSLIPTSTPLVKATRAGDDLQSRSEGSNRNNSEQWKKLGGPSYFEGEKSQDCRSAPEKNVKTMKSVVNSQKSESLPQRSSRSCSAERDIGDLVFKSMDMAFPSDLSRITQGSNSEQQNLWRYKSLEDLLPSHKLSRGQRDEARDIGLGVDEKEDGRRREGYSGQTKERGRSRKPRKTDSEKHVEFEKKRDRLPAPVQAMTSTFWEQQSEEEEEEQREQRHVGWEDEYLSERRHLGVIKDRHGKSGGGRFDLAKKDIHYEHDEYLDELLNSENQQEFRTWRDDDLYDRRDFDRMQPVTHSRSEPQRSRTQSRRQEGRITQKSTHHDSRNRKPESDARLYKGGNFHDHDEKTGARPMSQVPVRTPNYFMDEITDLRRSLEEMKPSSIFRKLPSKSSAGQSKMTRSTSEQSLHTVHLDSGLGRGGNPYSDIDALVSAYTTSASQFDLRPFSSDEQF